MIEQQQKGIISPPKTIVIHEDESTSPSDISPAEDDSIIQEPSQHGEASKTEGLAVITTSPNTTSATTSAAVHATTSSSAPTSSSNKRQTIKFDKVEIREYSRTVGDNPSCTSGPPISIGWEYNILGEFDLEYYESVKPQARCKEEMLLPTKLRFDMLHQEWGVRTQEMTAAVRENVRVKHQRKTTVNNLGGRTESFEVALESCSRKVNRLIKFQKPTSKQAELLFKQHQAAQYYYSKQRLMMLMEEENEEEESSQTMMKKSNLSYSSILKKTKDTSERSTSSEITQGMTDYDSSMRPDTTYYVDSAPFHHPTVATVVAAA